MIKGRSTGKIKCKESVVIGKTLVYNRGVQAGREFSLPECILETDEFTLYKDGKHMIKVQEYRGHIRNWEALCEELCIDKSLSRREREERILVRAFETWQFDMAAHLYGMFAFALWDEEEKQLFCLRDQFGTKPFYYYETEDGQLLYGTTIRGIMEQPGFVKELNEEMLQIYLSLTYVAGENTFFRGLKKLLGTYIDALPQLINPRTGRVHTSFNQTVTSTGRLSSSNPNLQNIPIRDENGKEIRKAFIPDEGCLFFSADYSQIELRIMAHLSEDKNMIDAFLSNHDIHAATAAKIYKIDLKDVDSDMRRKAKTANFGIIYGISVFGLAERMNVDRKEAKELIDGYFETYPSVKAYMEKSIQIAQEKGYVETIFHRKRFLPDINSRNAVVRGYAERNAINAPIQGSAADIIKVAMARIYQRFQTEGIQAKMILQVHDELNFSVPVNEKERVEEIVIEEMEHAYRMHVPLKADCGWGKNWLEAH